MSFPSPNQKSIEEAAAPTTTTRTTPLVTLNLTGLEAVLASLQQGYHNKVDDVVLQVDHSSRELQRISTSVNAMKSFLLDSMHQQMEAALATGDEEGLRATTSAKSARRMEAVLQEEQDYEESDKVGSILEIGQRLLAENAALRLALRSSNEAVAAAKEVEEQLQSEVVQLREVTEQQQLNLHRLSNWLGTERTPSPHLESNDSGSSGLQHSVREVSSPRLPTSSQEEEAFIAASPLLIAMRRILLRDLTERMAQVIDVQSRDFGNAVAGVKEEIKTQLGGQGGALWGDNGESMRLDETVRELTKTVKEITGTVVKRDEFTALMRSKADSLLLPVKADSAAVIELEKRVTDKYNDLAERVSYSEAERAELRAILKALIATRNDTVGAPLTSLGMDSSRNPLDSSAGLGKPGSHTTLRDLMRPESKPSRTVSQKGSKSPGQLYRILGDGQVGSTDFASGNAVLHLSGQAVSNEEGRETSVRSRSPRERNGGSTRPALNRKKVDSLPAIPYEKGSGTAAAR